MISKVLYLGLILIISTAHYACEDDAILEPGTNEEDYYGYNYGSIISPPKLPNKPIKKNPLIF
tara:strand:- start:290 stop:478 length:189 start_codon:yes stop_codon:yes gene_type:complete